MNTQEALADAAGLIRSIQSIRKCEARGMQGYCPVLVIGGSYPGFLAAMMRVRYPAVVDMAYASSAPLRFYSQEVSQYDYYAKVTESAKKSNKACPAAVKVGRKPTNYRFYKLSCFDLPFLMCFYLKFF